MRVESPHPVLVVSSDSQFQRMVVETTDRWEYTVTCAENRDEILREGLIERAMTVIVDLDAESVEQAEFLQQIAEQHPEVRIIAVIGHGNVDAAVQAMKVGAIDVIQKPASPQRLAEAIAAACTWRERQELDYAAHLLHARRDVSAGHLAAASAHLHIAIAEDPARPEAFNLLGAIQEIDGNRYDAMKHYRVALDLDPTYAPARHNLLRHTDTRAAGTLDLGQ